MCMQCPVLLSSKLADVVHVLLSEFQDPQLTAIVGASVKVGADGGGREVNCPRLL